MSSNMFEVIRFIHAFFFHVYMAFFFWEMPEPPFPAWRDAGLEDLRLRRQFSYPKMDDFINLYIKKIKKTCEFRMSFHISELSKSLEWSELGNCDKGTELGDDGDDGG